MVPGTSSSLVVVRAGWERAAVIGARRGVVPRLNYPPWASRACLVSAVLSPCAVHFRPQPKARAGRGRSLREKGTGRRTGGVRQVAPASAIELGYACTDRSPGCGSLPPPAPGAVEVEHALAKTREVETCQTES